MARPGRKVNKEKQEMFAKWLSLRKDKRVPATQTEWCEQNDVGTATAWRWKNDAEVRKLAMQYRMEIAEDSMADIVQALTNEAKDGQLPHAKFLMELLGDYVPTSMQKHQVDVTGVTGNGMTQYMVEFIAEEAVDHPSLEDYGISVDDMKTALLDLIIEEEE